MALCRAMKRRFLVMCKGEPFVMLTSKAMVSWMDGPSLTDDMNNVVKLEY